MSRKDPKPLTASFLARKGSASAAHFADPNPADPNPADPNPGNPNLAEPRAHPEAGGPESIGSQAHPEAGDPESIGSQAHPEASDSESPSPPADPPETDAGGAPQPRENYWITSADEIPADALADSPADRSLDEAAERTVLIVEDDPQNMNLFDELIRIDGRATLQATTGMQALDLARAHKPDLILLDIQLPDIPGTTVAERIKGDDALANIPIVAVTAFVADGLEEEILASGCDAYITKPITMAVFFDILQSFLD